jgi:hypothetical protein
MNTIEPYMKERSTHAGNVTTRQLQRVILLNTSKGYMKERSTHAGNVTTRQLQKAIWQDISIPFIWIANILVICVNIKQLERTNSRHTRINFIRVEHYKHGLILNKFSSTL